MKEPQRPPSGSGRSSRFLSDDSADAYCKAAGSREDGNPCFSDVFSGITDRAMAAAPSTKIFTGNIITDARDVRYLMPEVGLLLLYFVFSYLKLTVFFSVVFILFDMCMLI